MFINRKEWKLSNSNSKNFKVSALVSAMSRHAIHVIISNLSNEARRYNNDQTLRKGMFVGLYKYIC